MRRSHKKSERLDQFVKLSFATNIYKAAATLTGIICSCRIDYSSTNIIPIQIAPSVSLLSRKVLAIDKHRDNLQLIFLKITGGNVLYKGA